MGGQKDRMIGGELYVADDPELVADRLRCQLLLERYNATSAADEPGRRAILEELLGRVGAETYVLPPFTCDYGYLTRLGDRVFLNYGAIILDCAPVTIGDDVQIGPRLQLLACTHPTDPAARLARWERAAPITIEDGAWLGGGVIVGPGVTIGARTVVGAGSVVVRDLPSGVVAAGNPARVIRPLD